LLIMIAAWLAARQRDSLGEWMSNSTGASRGEATVAVGMAHFYNAGMIRPARGEDTPTIARLIRDVAEYERLAHEVLLDIARLRDHVCGPKAYAEVLLAEDAGQVVGFALFFHNYSTFLGKAGIYLEDLFVEPQHRGKGHGKALLVALARLAVERDCGRLEWS